MAWNQKEFYISTFFCCTGNGTENQKKCLIAAKRNGLNMVEFSFNNHEIAESGMAICEEIGLNYIATDMDRFTGGKTILDPEKDENLIKEIVDEKINNKYMVGYYTWDEVGRNNFERVRGINDLFSKYDPERLPFSLIYPSYGMYNWDKGEANWQENTYAQYVEDYIKIIDPPVLCVDYYPFLPAWFEDKLIENDIWRDMGLMHFLADKYNKPFWFYVQSVELGPDVVGRLTQEKIQVQLMSALAYDAKCISYYIATNYLYDFNGNDTDRSESGKYINKRVMTYGTYLFDKKITHLYHTGLDAKFNNIYFLDDINSSDLIASATDGMIIGEYDSEESIALMLVNKDYDNSLDTNIKLKSAKDIYVLNGNNGELELLAENTLDISVVLGAGDGTLLILK